MHCTTVVQGKEHARHTFSDGVLTISFFFSYVSVGYSQKKTKNMGFHRFQLFEFQRQEKKKCLHGHRCLLKEKTKSSHDEKARIYGVTCLSSICETVN